MGQLVFQATLGGQVNLVGPNTASTFNINVPAVAGNMVTTGDTGTVTNTMLAGSIANAKLTNSSVTIGSTNVALGATAATVAGLTLTNPTINGFTGDTSVINVGSGQFYKDTSGNVGIGTSSPSSSYKMSIIGSSAGSAPGILLTDTNTGGGIYSIYGSSGALIFRDSSAGATRALIDSSGNLLVGTTTALGKVTASTSSGTSLSVDASSSNDAVMRWSASGTGKAIAYWTPGTDRLYMATGSTGGLYLANGGTSWTAASDERVKDIIEPIENATQKLANWRTVIGKYKTDETGIRRSFLIAQDVLTTFPEAVDTSDANEYGVRYQDTIPLLVKSIQEQQALITQLQADVASLKAPQ